MNTHFGTNYTLGSGETYLWYGSDTKEAYNKNIITRKDKLKEEGFYPYKDLTYTVNGQGFRIDDDIEEKENRESIIILGCSITFGVGVEKKSSWPYIIEDYIGHKVYNLGVCGGSMDTYYRLLKYWLPILKSKRILILGHPGSRREFYNIRNKWTLVSSGVVIPNTDLFKDPDLLLTLLNGTEFYLNEQRNLDAMNYLAIQNNSQLHYISQNGLHIDQQARDLQHPGRNYHSNVAKLFKQKLGV